VIHSDLLNSLTDDEKVILLACIRHATGRDYKYEDLQWVRKFFLKEVLEKYYKIIKSDQREAYKKMVEKINLLLKLL
jgi:hypothetical protein